MFPVESTASSPNERSASEHINISSPQGPTGGPASAPSPSSQFEWAIKSIHGSKLGSPGNVATVDKHPSWEPMEAKAGPLEVMTLPTSYRQENPENYSGEGKDQDGEDANTPSAARAASGEEKEIEGSSEGTNYPGGFGVKVNNLAISSVKPSPESEPALSQSELVTVAELTTHQSQWQLVEQPTTPTQGFQEPDIAEEARGEILYVQRPTDNLSSASPQGRESSSNSGFTPVFRKYNKDKSQEIVETSTSEALMEMLTTSEATTLEPLTNRDAQSTDPTTTATTTENISDSFSTEEPSISISWVQNEKARTTVIPNLQEQGATPALTEGSQMTTSVVQFTIFPSDSKIAATEMESRSAVSESFVVGSRWTPSKVASSKSEERKTTIATDSNDTSNPFGILVPKWAFGLIPSGMSAP